MKDGLSYPSSRNSRISGAKSHWRLNGRIKPGINLPFSNQKYSCLIQQKTGCLDTCFYFYNALINKKINPEYQIFLLVLVFFITQLN